MSREELERVDDQTVSANEIPPTNRTVTGRGTYIARIRDGKIVEYRTHPTLPGS